MPSNLSESNIQISCIRWFDLQYPHMTPLLFHIRNGGSIKSAREGRKFKLMGVRKGVFDLFLSVPSKGFHGLYIELKKPGGKPSAEQKENKELFESKKYRVEFIDNLEQFMQIVSEYLKPL